MERGWQRGWRNREGGDGRFAGERERDEGVWGERG